MKVAPYTQPEHLRLSHVEYLAEFIVEKINTGLAGDGIYFLIQLHDEGEFTQEQVETIGEMNKSI
jgi:hypothetical protein